MTTETESARPDEGERIEDVRRRGSARVRLAWPLRRDGRPIRSIDLWPPTLDDLERLSAAPSLSAADVVAAAISLPAAVVRRLRWPDVSNLLEAARGLYPEGFFERFAAPDEPGTVAPDGVVPPAPPASLAGEAGGFDPTDPDDETLPSADAVDLADFVTPFRL